MYFKIHFQYWKVVSSNTMGVLTHGLWGERGARGELVGAGGARAEEAR